MSQTLADAFPELSDSPLSAVFDEMYQNVEEARRIEREITETLARLVGLHQRRHEIDQNIGAVQAKLKNAVESFLGGCRVRPAPMKTEMLTEAASRFSGLEEIALPADIAT